MPTARVKFGDGQAIITHQDGWQAGDMPPPDHDYLGWHAWAEVQHKAGLRQVECGKCSKWQYPQQLSDKTIEHTIYKDNAMTKPIKTISKICKLCALQPLHKR